MGPGLLLRLALWWRRPPSRRRMLLILVVLGIAAALVAVEQIFGWPEALTPAGGGRGPLRRPG